MWRSPSVAHRVEKEVRFWVDIDGAVFFFKLEFKKRKLIFIFKIFFSTSKYVVGPKIYPEFSSIKLLNFKKKPQSMSATNVGYTGKIY